MAKILKNLRFSSYKKVADNNTIIKKMEEENIVVVMKFKVNCYRCCEDIRNCINKAKGVLSVDMDVENEVATIKGAFDAEELKQKIFKKLKKRGEIVSQRSSKDEQNAIDNDGDNDDDADDRH